MLRRSLCFAACIVVGAAQAAYADTTGVVVGRIHRTNAPVVNGIVTLAGNGVKQSARADSRGRFLFSRVPFGRYEIHFLDATSAGKAEVEVSTDSVVAVDLAVVPTAEIGHIIVGSHRTPGSFPISVTTISRDQIAELPSDERLERVIENVPGIVRFSYDEPVAHGFHGVTYELDGLPLPRSTSSNFSDIIDLPSLDSVEVFTGSTPAEFGGSRAGAVVNLTTTRSRTLTKPESGTITIGAGSYGSAETTITDAVRVGTRTEVYADIALRRTNRGLDSPTFAPLHDSANMADGFLRSVTTIGKNDVLTTDLIDSTEHYQVPIATELSQNDPVVVPAATDDVQSEYSRMLGVSYTHSSADGRFSTRIAPWIRYDRIAYDGDLANDLAGSVTSEGTTANLDGLQQDRRSTFSGIRLTQAALLGAHALKSGIDLATERFSGNASIAYLDSLNAPQTFVDTSAQTGSTSAAYLEDAWNPTRYFSVHGGLRYDRSTGYVSGSQISPRLEIDGAVDEKNILHGYVGRLYAAPSLEDTRRAAVLLGGGSSSTLPVYDLQPERDSYYEIGLSHAMDQRSRWTLNLWKRDVTNVLDTTQLAQTPLFAVYNNAIGIAKGAEARIESHSPTTEAFVSATVSQSLAGGISGGTFLSCPPGSSADCFAGLADNTLQPEDHDQTVAINAGVTRQFGPMRALYATIEPQYGTGYPVQFQNGTDRLPPHLTFDAALGRRVDDHVGYDLRVRNLTNHQYVLKVNNGFNTTQWAEGRIVNADVTFPF